MEGNVLRQEKDRAYRIVANKGYKLLLHFIFINFFYVFFVVIFYDRFVFILHELACMTLSYIQPDLFIGNKRSMSCLWTRLELTQIPESSENPYIAGSVAIISLALMIAIPRLKMVKALSLWLMMIFLLSFITAVFFIAVPDYYPYTLQDFTQFYIQSTVYHWISIPIFLTAFLSFIPTSFISKFVTVGLTLVYAFLLGTTRYAFFVFVIYQVSYIFMPLVFFLFGPLVDIYIIVVFYSFHMSLAKLNYD